MENNNINLKISVNTAEVKSGIDDLKISVEEVKNAFEGAREKTDELNISAKDIGDFFKNALGKDFTDVKEKIRDITSVLGGLKDGFTAAKDLAATYGLENKKLEQAIDGVAKAQKIADGIQKAYGATVDIVSKAKKAYTAATNLASNGMKVFKVALASTGIGLVVTLIAALIANFDSVKEAVMGVVNKFPFLQKAVDGVKNVFDAIVGAGERFLSWLGFAPEKVEESNQAIADSNNTSVEDLKKAEEEKKKAAENALKEQQELAEKELEQQREKARELERIRQENLKKERDYRKLLIENMEEGREKELAEEQLKYESEKEKYAGNKKALEQLDILHKKRISEINEDFDNKEAKKKADAQNAILDADKKFLEDAAKQYDTARKNEKKAFDDSLKDLKQSYADKDLAERGALAAGQITKEEYERNKRERETQILQEQKDRQGAFFLGQQESAAKYYDDLLAKENEKLANKEITEQQLKDREIALKEQRAIEMAELTTQQAQQAKDLERTIEEDRIKTLQDNAEREKAIKKAQKDATIAITKQGLDFLELVSNELEKNGKQQNAMQRNIALVRLGIDTAMAISSALRNTSGPTADNAVTGGLAGVGKFIAISAQILTAAAKAKTILAGGQGAAGGSASAAAPSVSAPQVQAPQLGGRDVQVEKQPKPEPIKVFVTESDIRKMQTRVNVIDGQSVVV